MTKTSIASPDPDRKRAAGHGIHSLIRPSLRGLLIAALLSVSGAGLGGPRAAPPRPAPPADVLIVHDSLPGPISSGMIVGNNILDLLGHFGVKGAVVSIEEYKPGEAYKHRFVMVLGVDDRSVVYPPALLNDIRAVSVPVFWIGRHMADVTDEPKFAERVGFRVGRQVPEGITSVSYKGKSLRKQEPMLMPVEITDRGKVGILATAEKKDRTSLPYIVRSGSFWYCADSPFSYAEEGDRYLAFCDMLHDFFGMPHQTERKALLRLEDISVEEEPDTLRELADYLFDRHIPFQISLVPIFKDPKENLEIYLSDRPQFVRAIRYMVSKGGIVVMHGSTHQYHGKTGDDFEFWDEIGGTTIQGDSRQLVEQKLRAGLEECFKNGIYPVTWETPHYVASSLDYETFARYFNSSYERVAAANNADSGHYFPYPTWDRFGRFIIPEDLGFIALKDPNPDRLVADADRLQVVRDGVASFFFHPFMDQAYLEKVLDGIERLGYRFISIRDYDCKVQMDERLVQTFTRPVDLPIRGRYLHRLLVHEDGRYSAETYTDKPIDRIVKDPGLVPEDSILVMEGVTEIESHKEVPPPTAWENVKDWLNKKWGRKAPESYALAQPRAVVLWEDNLPKGDWNNQSSYLSALSSFGVAATARRWKELSRSALDNDTILIIPRAIATRLSAAQVDTITGFVREGGRIVLEGSSPLSRALGVRPESRSLKIKNIRDLNYSNRAFSTQLATWNPPADVTRFEARDVIKVYAQDAESELPVAFVSRFGRGRLMYLAARLDPTTPLGYTRYPYFVHYLLDGFSLRLPMDRQQVELYYDPGLAKGGGADIDRRAEGWREMGFRAIYVGAYQFWPAWSYNYAHLIDVCHKNGILVYAWLELPHVSVKFWNDHPEWRAKTPTGEDGLVGWRHHMDLENPDCREAAFAFVEDLLRKYPWDGVNIGELNYDTEDGPENPGKYLPMGASDRSLFKAQGGFDPILLFSPESPYYWRKNPAALAKFESYRSQRVVSWHRALLDRIVPLARERDMEIIVTMLDSLHTPTLTRNTGMDSRMIVGLMDEYPFTLQVEDPANFWAQSPDRYRRFGETYLRLVKDPSRLMFDINVVPDRDIENSHAPVPRLAGVELAQTLVSAISASGRAALYSEGTMPIEDLQMLSKVLAHQARVTGRWGDWTTESKRSILVDAPGQWHDFRVDGRIWPGWGQNDMFIPGGSHRITAVSRRISLFDTSALDLRLLRFTGNLDSLAPTDRGLRFSYDSQLRTLALFNRQPDEILVDGAPSREQPVPHAGHWSVRLPRGQHMVEIIADDTATVILDTASVYSANLIVIFGGVACALMLLMYMAILGHRAFARAVQGKSD